ncbi:MAG: hypothetical protein WA581_03000 [Candidatus Acidiferrales bacterium]
MEAANRNRTSQSDVAEECIAERHLWTAVVTRAPEDWRTGTLRERREAQKFLFDEGNDFGRVCAGAGLDPSSLRAQLSKIGHRINMKGTWSSNTAAWPFVLGLSSPRNPWGDMLWRGARLQSKNPRIIQPCIVEFSRPLPTHSNG